MLRFEETQRLHRMCRDLKNKPGLEAVLKKNYSMAVDTYSQIQENNDFREVLEPPQIIRKLISVSLNLIANLEFFF